MASHWLYFTFKSQKFTGYLDGKRTDETTLPMQFPAEELRIRDSYVGSSKKHSGCLMSNLMFYDKVLSDHEIEQEFKSIHLYSKTK